MISFNPENTLLAQYQFATASPIKYKHPAIIGGFGSGKTHAIPLRWLTLIDWRAKNQKVKTKLMVVEPTKEMIRDVLVPELDLFFDTFGIRHSYHKTYHNYTIWYKGYQFIAMLRSSDVPESLTGKTVSDIIIDEYDKKHSISHQRNVWKECIGRIRSVEYATCGVVTTPEGYKNTYELWGECEYREKKNFLLIRAKTNDNRFLPPDYVENLYDQYTEELVKQYVEAQFVNLTQGKVYYAFDRNENNTTKEYDKEFPLIMCVDFNVNPMKWCFVQNYGDTDYVIDQLKQSNTNTERMSNAVKERYGIEIPIQVYGDYTGNYGSTKTSSTDYSIIKSILPNVELILKPNPLENDRVNAVNSRFRNSRALRRLFVNVEKCPDVVKDCERVLYKENQKKIDKDTDSDLTHITDALGYYVTYKYPLRPQRRLVEN